VAATGGADTKAGRGTMNEPLEMRQHCNNCLNDTGYMEERNGQDVVRCYQCDAYAYCAPRTETGRGKRIVSTRPTIKPKRRARILDRDNGLCVVCGTTAAHIGHLLSVKDGETVGADDALIWSDENLAAMCEECNLGFGSRTPSPQLVYRVVLLHYRMNNTFPNTPPPNR